MARFSIRPDIRDRWGEWHEGNVYDVRQTLSDVDTYPNNFTCKVMIRHRKNGKKWLRRGKGGYTGNFAWVFISFQGKRVQLTELLRKTED